MRDRPGKIGCGITRRGFVGIGAASLAYAGFARDLSADDQRSPDLVDAIGQLQYLTSHEKFGTVERGTPLPYTLPPDKLREVGLERETWQLEVVADPESDAKLERPLAKELGTALDWKGLMQLAETSAVRFLKIMTCNNGGSPLGMGLWEGVPLRDVIWKARPVENIRRVFYSGYHNDDPKQLFQSSLPVGRVLEDPPTMPPVILCYKLNGEWLTGKRGGPVRMVVPEAYGFKSVKWLNRVVLSNLFHANDTYASGNNDVDSWLKTFARFVSYPEKIATGRAIPITGQAQVGISGLSRVQVWLHPAGTPLPDDDPYFTKGEWKEAEILPFPSSERLGGGGGLTDGRLPSATFGIDSETGKAREWPMRYSLAHWAISLPAPAAGKYELRCRTIDQTGQAQPLPRPFRKSGVNSIQSVTVFVEPA